jgi:hypothetical protein
MQIRFPAGRAEVKPGNLLAVTARRGRRPGMPSRSATRACGPGSGGRVVGDVGAQVADDEFDGMGDDVRDAFEGQAVAVVQRP